MDEMHQRHLDREDTKYLCQLHDSGRAVVHVIADEEEDENPVSEASHTAAASQPPCQSTGYDGEQSTAAASHTPPSLANRATTPLGDQHLNFEQCMTTLPNNNPQEANPEGAKSPLQQTPVQAIQGGEEMTHPPVESWDADFSQAPQQSTSLAERNTAVECIRFHRAPLPVLTLLSRAAGVAMTEAQHFTVERAVTILTSDSTWASSTPPQEINLGDQVELF